MHRRKPEMDITRCGCLLLLTGSILGGCQTPQTRQEQLAAICADPANREPKTAYFSECQTLFPSSKQDLQRNYRLGAPTGD